MLLLYVNINFNSIQFQWNQIDLLVYNTDTPQSIRDVSATSPTIAIGAPSWYKWMICKFGIFHYQRFIHSVASTCVST